MIQSVGQICSSKEYYIVKHNMYISIVQATRAVTSHSCHDLIRFGSVRSRSDRFDPIDSIRAIRSERFDPIDSIRSIRPDSLSILFRPIKLKFITQSAI